MAAVAIVHLETALLAIVAQPQIMLISPRGAVNIAGVKVAANALLLMKAEEMPMPSTITVMHHQMLAYGKLMP